MFSHDRSRLALHGLAQTAAQASAHALAQLARPAREDRAARLVATAIVASRLASRAMDSVALRESCAGERGEPGAPLWPARANPRPRSRRADKVLHAEAMAARVCAMVDAQRFASQPDPELARVRAEAQDMARERASQPRAPRAPEPDRPVRPLAGRGTIGDALQAKGLLAGLLARMERAGELPRAPRALLASPSQVRS